VREHLKEREREGIRMKDPVYRGTYSAARLFLHRIGKKVLGRSIHYHLFRHSSATFYASRMNRQQLCIRYGQCHPFSLGRWCDVLSKGVNA
jgi:hypothetical protein